MSDSFKVLFGMIIGAAAGVVTGVLIAPTSGKETREKVQDKTIELLEGIKDLLTKEEEKAASEEAAK
jgi:gas vesicle protein